ncbi:hypothetical protein VC83_02700 [Pseudogymnoascus destructans]|uniref:Uncharacterized protein n=1 Tax=Pseudogymnoascus destructans TaxID=655981 RepID=A0A177AIV3_9PEZI|nr:uncharacterized protein VC83_02700 [Pseudogymnoascus destructans]OAF61104.1 hypothetical protein VC83_02700 [Pseudogymnoascus destructans]
MNPYYSSFQVDISTSQASSSRPVPSNPPDSFRFHSPAPSFQSEPYSQPHTNAFLLADEADTVHTAEYIQTEGFISDNSQSYTQLATDTERGGNNNDKGKGRKAGKGLTESEKTIVLQICFDKAELYGHMADRAFWRLVTREFESIQSTTHNSLGRLVSTLVRERQEELSTRLEGESGVTISRHEGGRNGSVFDVEEDADITVLRKNCDVITDFAPYSNIAINPFSFDCLSKAKALYEGFFSSNSSCRTRVDCKSDCNFPRRGWRCSTIKDISC